MESIMRTTEPVVDVIILSWGRIPDTCAAIDSALRQKGVGIRVIVVDQGTAAAELGLLKAHVEGRQQVTLVCNDENRGVPGGRNQASALGTGDFIVALDNDAEFASDDEVAIATGMMNDDETIAVLAFRILLYSTDGDDKSSWPFPLPIADYAATRFDTARFVGAGHMLRRSSFEACGCYDDTLIFLHEEVDLSYRLLNLGKRAVYEPSVRIRHKVSTENRVSWTGNRYYFHVRNTIYIAAKYNFSPLSGLLSIWIALQSGVKSGYVKGTLRGLLHGLLLVSKGLRQRWFDKRVRLTSEAKDRIKQTSPTRNMSLLQKFIYRTMPRLRSTR